MDDKLVEALCRTIAETNHIDLSMAIHCAGGITNAVAAFGMDEHSDDPRYKEWRVPSCRGVVLMARAVLPIAMEHAAGIAERNAGRSVAGDVRASRIATAIRAAGQP